jgi:large subunit ribosomal protein L21
MSGEVKIGGSIMKYAIVQSGGKQYKAVEGATIDVDRLPLEEGKKLNISDVLLISDEAKITVGTPTVAGAKVSATVVEQFKAPKIIVFKYKSRQRYRVKQGHRQQYTRLMINKISAKAEKKTEAAKEEAKPKTKTATKTKTAAKSKTSTKKAATETTTEKPE